MVFMAEQQHPIRRRVALKVLKAGMDTRQVVARFEAERQALALMEHVGIARVLDGGETPSGRPYFVMELVKGIPITRFCDEHQLTPRERLALFVQVCQAVQHAHQKGIIHRDLKPTNVLVAAYDGKPVPKVIDFGVAKALGQQLTERTLVTGFGSIVGTLEYMSPEQAEFNAMDVDTRADIYSLGVLLYELLTGTTPLSSERLKLAAMTEVLRLIREEEPPKPSTRLSDSRDSLASISAQRRLEPASLTKEVRGELDWIVMKALEKDRNRRYETANGLARDIDRYLNDEPVEASSPGTAYRLRKFVRRNRGPVLAASLLLAGAGGRRRRDDRRLGASRAGPTGGGRRAVVSGWLKSWRRKGWPRSRKQLASSARCSRTSTRWRRSRKAGRCGRSSGSGWIKRPPSCRGRQSATASSWPSCKTVWDRRTWGWVTPPKRRPCSTKAVRTRQDHLGARPPPHARQQAQPGPWRPRLPETGIRPSTSSSKYGTPGRRVLGADHRDTLSTVNELAKVYNRVGKPNTAIPLLEQVRDGSHQTARRRPRPDAHDPAGPGRGVPLGRKTDRGHCPGREGMARPGQETRG